MSTELTQEEKRKLLLAKKMWEAFDHRASTWQRDQGELGDMIASELRTVNNAWFESFGEGEEEP